MSTLPPNQDITVEQLKEILESDPQSITLIDVREASERQISVLPDQLHIPLGTLPVQFEDLERSAELVLYCRTGNRSGQAAAFLRANGFTNVRNVLGGINHWAATIDPTLPQY
jgi:adenylyltransferase/sulfurtransferase